jgi:hypothetical protein
MQEFVDAAHADGEIDDANLHPSPNPNPNPSANPNPSPNPNQARSTKPSGRL